MSWADRIGRLRADEVERHAREFAAVQEAREVLRDALAEVWSGADFTDADAVIDQLDDRGYRVVRK